MIPHPDCTATVRRHGTYSAARYGCTCPEALADRRRYNKLHHHGYAQPRWIDATGTRRRLQALWALGWSGPHIADRLGITPRAVSYLLAGQTVTTSTADRVRQVYDELSMHPGPSARARALAQKRRWVPPLAWDDDEIDTPDARPHCLIPTTQIDETAVERAVRGERRKDEVLPRVERHAAIRRCRQLGIPGPEIARRVGVSPRTVDRVAAAVHTKTISAA
ncbi:transcriptional regulator with XRE-family HTH domain [Saccharothrix coeruleofusca]|uniref:helix-turn-helix domain-containing protein n=1 Tax=Saccharothrix coeruleofusca TaxID=33919 RepID=UPI001AE85BF9|nr:helix-turn-helix domain-containing protein [Saccharothrix coeruleofusca]MBP2341054.1 transcriptional regulator with XRE-family HTH domain [Saccharothrix coeruleofusca]